MIYALDKNSSFNSNNSTKISKNPPCAVCCGQAESDCVCLIGDVIHIQMHRARGFVRVIRVSRVFVFFGGIMDPPCVPCVVAGGLMVRSLSWATTWPRTGQCSFG